MGISEVFVKNRGKNDSNKVADFKGLEPPFSSSKDEKWMHGVALCFAAKSYKRVQKALAAQPSSKPLTDEEMAQVKEKAALNAYVLNTKTDIKQLHNCVLDLATNNLNDDFQFVYFNPLVGHWNFGEIRIDSKEKEVKILVVDPLQEKDNEYVNPPSSLNVFLDHYGFNLQSLITVLPGFKFQFYLPNTKLQTTNDGCDYHAIYGCHKLSNQDTYESIYQFMNEHKEFPEKSSEEDKILDTIVKRYKGALKKEDVIIAPAPGRLQLVSFNQTKREQYFSEHNEEKSKRANLKGKTAYELATEHSGELFIENPEGYGNYTTGNTRLNSKVLPWKQDLLTYCPEGSTVDGKSKQEAVSEHLFAGLQKRVKKLVANKQSEEKHESDSSKCSTAKLLQMGAMNTSTLISDKNQDEASRPTAVSLTVSHAETPAVSSASTTKTSSPEESESKHEDSNNLAMHK